MTHRGFDGASCACLQPTRDRLLPGGSGHWPFWAKARLVAALLAVVSVAACGGGGASSSAQPPAQPLAQVSPASLTFGSQNLGTTSATRAETVTNTGTANLIISTVTIGGTNASDFTKSADTCTGATVTPNNTCTVSVTFTPSATGSRSASLNLTDNASNSPHTVALTGTGTAPVVSLSLTNLAFGNEPVDTTSAAQAVTINNTGNAALSLTSIALTGTNAADFAQTNTCANSLAIGANCTVVVMFTPSANGSRTAVLNISDNAVGSPQIVSLSGTGTDATPIGSLSSINLDFGNQSVHTASAVQTVTLTNGGKGTLIIRGITISGEFTQTNDCGTNIVAGAHCTINVTFIPTTIGAQYGAVGISYFANETALAVSLSGAGIVSDNFQRANGALGGSWDAVTNSWGNPIGTWTGGIQILNDAFGPINAVGGQAAAIFPGTFSNDQWAQAEISTIAPPTSTIAITAAAAQSNGNTAYTYTLTSGNALIIPQEIIITGMTNSGNNGPFLTTALGSGTFTVANASGVNETGSSGTGISPSDSGDGLIVRGTPDGLNGYQFDACNNSYSYPVLRSRTYCRELWKSVNGVATMLWGEALYPIPDSPGDVYKLSVVGTTITVYKNGAVLCTANDSSLTSGSPGIFTFSVSGPHEYDWANWGNFSVMGNFPGNNGTRWTNWQAGDVTEEE